MSITSIMNNIGNQLMDCRLSTCSTCATSALLRVIGYAQLADDYNSANAWYAHADNNINLIEQGGERAYAIYTDEENNRRDADDLENYKLLRAEKAADLEWMHGRICAIARELLETL